MEWNTEDVTAELVKQFGEEAHDEIVETLDLDKGRYSDWGTAGSVTIDGTEYNLIADDDEAERIALEIVKQDLDEEPSIFNQDWLSSFIEISETDKRVMAADEEDHIREMVEDDAKREIFDNEEEEEEWIENEVEKRRNEFEEALDDPIQYFVHDQGIYSIEDLLKQPWIRINTNEAAEDAVSTDGWAHFLSHYDGNYETTPDGLVFFRED
jgi:predicted nucleic acid-binding protein